LKLIVDLVGQVLNLVITHTSFFAPEAQRILAGGERSVTTGNNGKDRQALKGRRTKLSPFQGWKLNVALFRWFRKAFTTGLYLENQPAND